MTILKTIMTICVHKPDQNPAYGEGVTHISLENDGDGNFFRISQPLPFEVLPAGEIAIDPDELVALEEAGRMLLAQPGARE